MLSVTGGEMTIPGIVSQMQRLVPSDTFHWDVRQVGHNVYKVPFPSKAELERMRVFGTFHVPNSSIEFNFDSWIPTVEPNCLLPEIWMRVSGLPPKRIGDYLAIWSLGILFGKTLEVDMKFTRQHGVARLRIGCLDYTCIPHKQNVFVKDGFYDLTFVVELPGGDEVMEEVTEDRHDGHTDDDQTGNHNLDAQNQQRMDHTSTNSESQNGGGNLQPESNGVAGAGGTQVAKLVPGVCFSPKVRRMIEQSQQFLRSYMPTNTQKQNETVFSVMVQNAQGKNDMQFQLQPDNVSATCDMEFLSEAMPTESAEAVV
jgi:hypothetical protein